jgi:hypothetical protein
MASVIFVFGECPFFTKLAAIRTSLQMAKDNSQSDSQQMPDFEKAELDLLRENLRRSYKERFLMATRLYKIQQTMQKAIITHKPFVSK